MGWNDCFAGSTAGLPVDPAAPQAALARLVAVGFALLPDNFLARYLQDTLDIADSGPFEVHSAPPARRYGGAARDLGWPGLFVSSPATLLVGETPFGTAAPSGDLILSHLALMLREERLSGARRNLRLQFIVPAGAGLDVLGGCGLAPGRLPRGWIAARMSALSGRRLAALLFDEPGGLVTLDDRVEVAVATWAAFHGVVERFADGLDGLDPGEQTLCRLLDGLRAGLESGPGTGLLPPLDKAANPAGRLAALAGFAHRLADPDASMGRWGRAEPGAPSVRFIEVSFQPSELFNAFALMCHRSGWVVDFDWSRWLETAEGLRLTSGPEAVLTATPLQLSKLITAILRRNHYAEGTIEDDFESGLLAAIAERGRALAGA